MPDDPQIEQQVVGTEAAPEGATGGGKEAHPDGVKPLADGRVQILSSNAYRRIKEEAREKGKKDVMTETEQKLKAAGYTSIDELIEKAKAGKGSTSTSDSPDRGERRQDGQKASGNQQQRRDDKPSNRANAAWDKERQKLIRERDEAKRLSAQEERKRRDMRKKLEDRETEMALREAAISAGVRDVDYAVRLLTRHVEGKDEAALKGFDEAKYFEGLRESHPYLFGETVRPATTGTGAGAAPAAPKPGQATAAAAQNGQIDARKMNQKEFEEHLRKRGLNAAS